MKNREYPTGHHSASHDENYSKSFELITENVKCTKIHFCVDNLSLNCNFLGSVKISTHWSQIREREFSHHMILAPPIFSHFWSTYHFTKLRMSRRYLSNSNLFWMMACISCCGIFRFIMSRGPFVKLTQQTSHIQTSASCQNTLQE